MNFYSDTPTSTEGTATVHWLPPAKIEPPGLLPAEEDPDQRDLARNGSYWVLRQLAQDVAGFWRFLDDKPGEFAEQPTELAEAMVGRSMNGEPLAPLSSFD